MEAINMQQWLKSNGRKSQQSTDLWYMNFARKLAKVIKGSPYLQKWNVQEAQTASSLTVYFQDAIAQTGGWKAFKEMYQQLYKQTLPFYPLNKDYADDEVNPEDIAYLLWSFVSSYRQEPVDPQAEEIIELSQKVYQVMNDDFEEAPISDVPSSKLWLQENANLKKQSTPLPELAPDTVLSKEAKECLTYSNGYPLLYFKTLEELVKFFKETLHWENNAQSLVQSLQGKANFVIYANAKGMLLAHSIAQFFKDSKNPCYDENEAIKDGWHMLFAGGVCPFDLLKYGFVHGLLTDLQFPYNKGKEVLQENWDFLARFYLKVFYEAE